MTHRPAGKAFGHAAKGPGSMSRPGAPAPHKPSNTPPPAAPPTDWTEAADWYDQLVGDEGSEYHKHVVLPGAMRMLALKAGDRALDIACGQGVLCRLMATHGIWATGVDASAELIKMAKKRGVEGWEEVKDEGGRMKDEGEEENFEVRSEKREEEATLATENSQLAAPDSGPVRIRYHLGDARDLSFLPPAEFDAAACLLAIQNIHPIGPVFKAVARVIVPMGRFVVVMMHPCFRGPKATAWQWDEKTQYRRVDRYLLPRKAPIVTNPGRSTQYTWSFHKPIGDYVKAARNAGLLVDAIEEWPSHKTSTSGPRAAAENVARKEIPMFLAMRVVKAGKEIAGAVEESEGGEG